MNDQLIHFFNPRSIAVIGATERPGSVGLGLCRNLLEEEGERQIFFINPSIPEILGRKTFAKIGDIAEPIDLAVIAVPCQHVVSVARESVEKKVRGVIVISSGFAEVGDEGAQRQQELQTLMKEAGIPLLGPNCLGFIAPSIKLNVSFSPATPRAGEMAFLSQSGALIDSVIDKSLAEWYGFSYLISYGNEADLDICDLLEFLRHDPQTKVIAIYLESIKDGRRFIEIASAVAREKPVVILKGGKTELGRQAAASHTASLAGVAEIYSAAFQKAGIFEVQSINELLYVSLALGFAAPCRNNIAIITNGGAAGVLTADCCSELEVRLAKINKHVLEILIKSPVMNPAFSRANPLDILGDALSARYLLALDALVTQKDIEGLIVIQTIQVMTEVEKNAQAIIQVAQKCQKPILCLILGGKMAEAGIRILSQNKIACFTEPKTAVLAMKALITRNKLTAGAI